MFKGFKPEEGKPAQFLGIYALKWPWNSQVEPTIAFVEVDEWSIFERAIKLMTLAMEEIDSGCPNWRDRGGQSYGWKVMHWLQARYKMPNHIKAAIINGYLRWIM